LFFVYDHRELTVLKDGFYPKDIFDYLNTKDEFKHFLKDKNVNNLSELDQEKYDEYQVAIDDYFDFEKEYYVFPVIAYIHSGVVLSLKANQYPFNDRFDSCCNGFVLLKRSEFNEGKSYQVAESLIKEWNQYLSGDVWYYILFKKKVSYSTTGSIFQDLIDSGHIFDTQTQKEYFTENICWDEIDSCGGFYGDDFETNGLLEQINKNIKFEL